MQMLYDLDHGGPTVETWRGRPFQCQAVEVAAQTLVEERRQMDFVKLKLSVIFVRVDQRGAWVVIYLTGGGVGVPPLFLFFSDK